MFPTSSMNNLYQEIKEGPKELQGLECHLRLTSSGFIDNPISYSMTQHLILGEIVTENDFHYFQD